MKKQENEIRFKFIYDEQYNLKYINGVWGGVTPSGEFNMNFFVDRLPVPKNTYQEVTGEGIITDRVRQDIEEKLMVRCVQTGVVFNYVTAKILHQWLGEQIGQFEERTRIVSQNVTPENQ
ncbi:hypothetical protein JCM15519_07320 [Fundidesulfovibrio butyratiphilus]